MSARGKHIAVFERCEDALTVLAAYTAFPPVVRNALKGLRPSHSLALAENVEFGGLDSNHRLGRGLEPAARRSRDPSHER